MSTLKKIDPNARMGREWRRGLMKALQVNQRRLVNQHDRIACQALLNDLREIHKDSARDSAAKDGAFRALLITSPAARLGNRPIA